MKKNLVIIIALLMIVTLVGCNQTEEKFEAVDEKEFKLEKEDETTTSNDEQEEDTDGTSEVKDAETVIEEDAEILKIVLYLKYEEKAYLYDEIIAVKMTEDLKEMPVYQLALDLLIQHKGIRDLVTPIPKGTKVLNHEIVDGELILDFSSEFLPTNMSKENAGLVIASVTNTMIILGDVESVTLKVEGQPLKDYFGYKVDEKMDFKYDFFTNK